MHHTSYLHLAQGEYLNMAQDLRITGSTGVGKSDLPTARW